MTGGSRRNIGAWVGAGAVSLGVGAAIACGCGVANADADTSHASAHSASARSALSGKPARPAKTRQAVVVRPSGSSVGRSNRTISATPAPVATATASQTVSWHRRIQEAIVALVPIINNTPIRNLLDIVDPPSGPGSTVIRLPQKPISVVVSADGTRAFAYTAPPVWGGLLGSYHYPSFGIVTEIDFTTRKVVGTPAIVNGTPNAIVLSDDGSRVFVTTRTGVTVLDTKDCTVVGAPITVGGSLTLVPGGTRGYLIGTGSDSTGKATTTMTPIDGSDGTVSGNTVVLEGIPVGAVSYSSDGKRAYLTTELQNLDPVDATAVNTVDTVGNTVVGQPLVLDGFPVAELVLSPDGARASQTTVVGGDVVVTVIEPIGGTMVGQPVAIHGTGSGGVGAMFSAHGTRINLIVQQGTSTVMTVIDTSTSTVVGTPVVLPGNNYFLTTAVVPDQNGPMVYVLADIDVPGFITSCVATVVDSSDSTVVGTPVTLKGAINGGAPLAVSPDGTRVYQTTTLDTGNLPYTTYVYTVGTDSRLVSTVSIPDSWGYGTLPLVLKPDGSRAYQLTEDMQYRSFVTVIDTATGLTVKSPFTHPALAAGLTFAPGGNYAYAFLSKHDPFSPYGTRLSVFDASKI